jgi:1,2-diacylglycerol 3-beta-glucosyltransferase
MRRALASADGAGGSGPAAGSPPSSPRPFVSLVVPARDEAPVIGALVADLAALRYHDVGQARYEAVIVDDGSSDATGRVARTAAAGSRQVRVVRRESEGGPATKAAVLAWAQPYLRGEVLGVLDADARVAPDFLDRLMCAWQRDAGAVAIQAQRRPAHSEAGWLVAAQHDEQLVDMASQCGRWATDGTAELRGNGMAVRRDALDRAGGWSEPALTEDLELSTRLAIAGDRVTLAPEVTVGEEAPRAIGTLWRQRMRWAEGSLRRLLEHGAPLLGGAAPLRAKADFLAFACEFLVPPLFAAAVLASLATVPLPRPADWTVPLSLAASYALGSFAMALAGLAARGVRGAALIGRAARAALFMAHWLVVVPAALVRIALADAPSGFSKTPRAAADGPGR